MIVCVHLTLFLLFILLFLSQSLSSIAINHYQSKSPSSTTTVHHGFHHQQHTAKRIMEVGECVDIVVQHSQQGFSHAIHCGKEFLGDERFMVVSVFSPLVTGTSQSINANSMNTNAPFNHLQHTFTTPSPHLHHTFNSPSPHLQFTFTSPSLHLHFTFTSLSTHLLCDAVPSPAGVGGPHLQIHQRRRPKLCATDDRGQ